MNYEDAVARYVHNSLSCMREGDVFTLPYAMLEKTGPDALGMIKRRTQKMGMAVRFDATDGRIGVVCTRAAIK